LARRAPSAAAAQAAYVGAVRVHHRNIRDDHRVGHHCHDVATAVDHAVPHVHRIAGATGAAGAAGAAPQTWTPSVTGDAAPRSRKLVVVYVAYQHVGETRIAFPDSMNARRQRNEWAE
jgi:hypothetical protein